ncbi:hypothetical protein DFP73DRAFT_561686 [Morchella snyderi]|nr:hypothetical protein DFP73DRAFT_561686 [Morchella snyderi]
MRSLPYSIVPFYRYVAFIGWIGVTLIIQPPESLLSINHSARIYMLSYTCSSCPSITLYWEIGAASSRVTFIRR